MLDEALVLRQYRAGSASIDVDVVSWNVPIPLLSKATWGPGMPAYNWQAMAASGMSVDGRGALNAVKVMALAAVQLYRASQAVAAAKDGFSQGRGADFIYQPLLQRTAPPLDCRRNSAD